MARHNYVAIDGSRNEKQSTVESAAWSGPINTRYPVSPTSRIAAVRAPRYAQPQFNLARRAAQVSAVFA